MPQTLEFYLPFQIQFGMALHAGLLCFGMRSQARFAPGKDFLVRLDFDLPAPGTAVSAISLRAHQPSPLAQLLVAQVRELAAID
jgi:hypothetical protein